MTCQIPCINAHQKCQFTIYSYLNHVKNLTLKIHLSTTKTTNKVFWEIIMYKRIILFNRPFMFGGKKWHPLCYEAKWLPQLKHTKPLLFIRRNICKQVHDPKWVKSKNFKEILTSISDISNEEMSQIDPQHNRRVKLYADWLTTDLWLSSDSISVHQDKTVNKSR